MKVAYFLGALNMGGAEAIVRDICKEHETLPYTPICLYRKEGNISETIHNTGAQCLHIQHKNLFRYLYQLRRTIIQEKIDIVHSQTPSNTLLCALALFGTKVKVITTFHGHSFANAAWWQRKIVYWKSEQIICVSEYEKQYYEQKWHLPNDNKLVVVHNGVDFTKLDTPLNLQSQTTNHKSQISLCMVGNFQGGRSPMVICQALNRLKAKQPSYNVQFYFIGKRVEAEPWRYDECVRYCEEHNLANVHFLGGRNDVPELLHQMDGFVYSTEHDTFGIAVVEAMAAGVPVIVNDWAVMKEITKAGKWATLFKSDDIAACANAIEDLLNNLEARKADAKEIAKQVREEYSIEKHIERLDNIYRLVIGC